ncbi:hypothetical protein K2224_34390 (plasmid) [Streptomyces sp. BHT-5-2]|uniref:WXG100 family type VII secretion target n=1 Tax=unclassified Streptomyces TaxID=2593676 RepID=UPI001C8E591E|nr:hypothetical protein [Streptomyces sp. BHT-5-2]QZL08224.1 hypothetical protein K2224_34390 [Streptomyces sp. BHT-5-2]
MGDGAKYDYDYTAANQCFNAKHESDFASMDMDTMKAMVKASNPGEVHSVAQGWSSVHNQLVGGSGGGIKGAFDAAVNEVLQSWHGAAAEKFKAQAQIISKKIGDGASYADYTSRAMKNAASILEHLKPEIESMEKPSGFSSAMKYVEDGGHDDSGLKSDLKSGMSTQDALDRNSDSLSAGKVQQLHMAVKMEQLGAAYVSQARSMGTWNSKLRSVSDHEDYPGSPDGGPPPPIPMPMPSGSPAPRQVGRPSISGMGQGPGGSSRGVKAPTLPTTPNTPGISGGVGAPAPGKGSLGPKVNTGLESFTPPSGGGGGGGATGIGGGAGGLGGGVHGGGGIGGGAGGGSLGGGGIGGGAGGLIGGGGSKGASAGIKGGGAGAGGAGAGAAGRGAGRPGMPGMGGAAGAKGGAKGAGGAGRGAPLARQKGGIIGGGSGKSGAAGQGGSGLHRSRGGAQAGAGTGGRRPAGMAGAPGAHGAKGKDNKGQGGERPDYLVEDEETWTPERNIAPKVIE